MDATTLIQMLDQTPRVQVSPGISYKWLNDRRILYVIGEASRRSDVDAWYEFLSKEMREWPDDRTYLAVQDLSSPNFALTPYARARASETYKVRPTLKGRVAIIMPKTFVAYLLQFFIRGERRNHFDTRFFLAQHEALAWLAEAQPEGILKAESPR